MKHQTFFKAVLCCSLVILTILSAQASAQSRRGGLYGDWQIKYQAGERQREAIISFSRDSEGNRTGQWISFMSLSELKDLKYEDGQFSFTRDSRNRDGQSTTSKFTGTIQDGKLSGTLSSDRGEYKVEGKPSPRIARAVGSWQMTLKMEDRQFNSTMVVKADQEGKLSAEWQSERGNLTIPEVQYERGNLSFKMERKSEDRQWQASFEGTIQRETDTLTGTLKSNRGEIEAVGKRAGTPLIGTWILESTSERGTRKQRLRINPDMSGLYGSIPVKNVALEGDKVNFKIVLEFGDQKFEMGFAGKLEDSKLAGEMTSSRGSWKITGTKVISTFRRRSGA
ncbi:MAG: hypothetical protein H8E73_09530 [Planctomycetes bacterium]|nr:hypothetical protein [Planctomycetota bacterium]